MSGEIDFWIPYVLEDSNTRCVLINPDRFVKEYYWTGASIDDLLDALDAGYTKTSNLREMSVKNYTVLYDKNEQTAEDFISIFCDGKPVCYGPCIVFGKDMTPLDTDGVSELCNARCLRTHNGSTCICVKL
jgi:hypothetical protein